MNILLKYKLLLVFLLALALRLYGLNWDQGNHLHPDERFLTMVAADIKLPSSITQYFSTSHSPLNPYNYPQYQFFVYGTFPLFLTKILASILSLNSYDQIHFLGRGLSALFDASNVILLYYLSRKRILPSLVYALMVLPIQLSHFFAVDTFLATFLLATYTALSYKLFFLAAFAFGLALACKISALYFVPIIFIFLFIHRPKKFLLITVCCLLITFITFRVFQPYSFSGLFTPNPQFISNLNELKQMAKPQIYFPPSVQWIGITPILFPLKNIIFWGVGLPFCFLFVFSIIKKTNNKLFIPLAWVSILLIAQGVQSNPMLRYFLPIYPALALVVTFHKSKIFKLFLIFHIIYALSYLSIYSVPNSRVQATTWINNNIEPNEVITSEYWDDALPLGFSKFQSKELHLYDPDTPEKWQVIDDQLASADYIIMSSNRLWSSIPRVPQHFPQTSKFYQDLFSGKLDFQLEKSFTSYPGFRLPIAQCFFLGPSNYPGVSNRWFETTSCDNPGIYFRDDTAEESFTVYDHPQVLVFKKSK